MRIAVADPEVEALVDLWCETFTTGDYPRCKAIAVDLAQRTSFDNDPDQFLFARKSLAQSLHFLGEHDASRQIALEVRCYPVGEIATTMVHPHVSMGVLLVRIAALKGDLAASEAGLKEVADYAARLNPIGLYQVLALAAIPIAFWRNDGPAAAAAVHDLRLRAERSLHNYWMGWAANAAVAVGTVFGQEKDLEDGQIAFDQLDPKQADHLATLDGRFISDIASSRVQSGECGWTAIEVTRMRALAMSWFDPAGALQVLDKARDLARSSGVTIWNDRLCRTGDEIAARTTYPHQIFRSAG